MLRLGVDAGNFVRDRRGMGRFVRSVIAAARADPSIELELISLHRKDNDALRTEFSGVRLRHAWRARRHDAYDVVWYPWNGIRFRVRVPSLVTIYDAFAFDEPQRDPIARWREQGPIRQAARRATKISTISNWSRERIARTLSLEPARIVVIPPAADPFFTPGETTRISAPLAGRRFVLIVGAREPRKNARTLIAACARAFAAPEETLAVAGGFSDGDRRSAKALGLNFVELEPDDEELRALYRGAALVAIPSSAEGFGLVAVEAMACGAPVIAAAVAALPEATGDAAILLDPFDIESWAREIRALLDDPALAEHLREAGLRRIAATDRSAPTRATIALLREVANLRS